MKISEIKLVIDDSKKAESFASYSVKNNVRTVPLSSDYILITADNKDSIIVPLFWFKPEGSRMTKKRKEKLIAIVDEMNNKYNGKELDSEELSHTMISSSVTAGKYDNSIPLLSLNRYGEFFNELYQQVIVLFN